MRSLPFLLFLVIPFADLFSQSRLYYQPQNSPVFNNPAFVGGDTLSGIILGFKNGRPGLKDHHSAKSIAFTKYLGRLNAYAGISILYARINDNPHLNQQHYNIYYAQNIKIGKQLLVRPAIEFGYHYSNIYMMGQIPMEYFFGEEGTINSPRISSGFLFYWKKLTAGIATKYYMDRTWPKELIIQGSYDLVTNISNQQLHIQPYLYFYNVYYSQYDLAGLRMGAVLIYRGYTFGGGYNRGEDPNIIAGYEWKQMRLLYGWGRHAVRFRADKVASHELSLSYRFWKKPAHRKFLTVEGLYH